MMPAHSLFSCFLLRSSHPSIIIPPRHENTSSAALPWQGSGIGQASLTPFGRMALTLHGPAAPSIPECTAILRIHFPNLPHTTMTLSTNLPPPGPNDASKETTQHSENSTLGQNRQSVTCWIGCKLICPSKTVVWASFTSRQNSSHLSVLARHSPRNGTSSKWSTPITKPDSSACEKCFATQRCSPSIPTPK